MTSSTTSPHLAARTLDPVVRHFMLCPACGAKCRIRGIARLRYGMNGALSLAEYDRGDWNRVEKECIQCGYKETLEYPV